MFIKRNQKYWFGSLLTATVVCMVAYDLLANSLERQSLQLKGKEVYYFFDGATLIREKEIKMQLGEVELHDYYRLLELDGSQKYLGENISSGRVSLGEDGEILINRKTELSSMDRAAIASLLEQPAIGSTLKQLGLYNYSRMPERLLPVDLGIAGLSCYLKNRVSFHCSLLSGD